MKLSKLVPILFINLVCFSPLVAQETPTGNEMVLIGNKGNLPYHLQGVLLGAVNEDYYCGKYEQTVQDWCDFLIATASQLDNNNHVDAHGLWNSGMAPWITRTLNTDGSYAYSVVEGKGNLPITHVSLYSALRKCNWHEHHCPTLHQGEDMDAITEHGAYEFAVNGSFEVNSSAHFFVPTHDEWIKAAYYSPKGVVPYSLYPTQHSTPPGNQHGDVTNQANYNSRSLFAAAPLGLTAVDFFDHSKSYYGCFDMGGNVNEWTITPDTEGNYIVRGGSYKSEYNYGEPNDLMITATPQSFAPATESDLIGFRMIQIKDEGAEGSAPSAPSEGESTLLLSTDQAPSPINRVSGWNSLSFGEKVGIVTGGVVIVGAAVAGGYWLLLPAEEIAEDGAMSEGLTAYWRQSWRRSLGRIPAWWRESLRFENPMGSVASN